MYTEIVRVVLVLEFIYFLDIPLTESGSFGIGLF